MKNVSAFGAGLVFAMGLGLSGMTQPTKVVGFLDVAGAWDPSLAFVMLGAIAVHAIFVRRSKGSSAPRFATAFSILPPPNVIDGRLLVGAALFGVGWGIAGLCPGPALVSLVTLAPASLAFVASMLVGMGAYALAVEGKFPRLLRSP